MNATASRTRSEVRSARYGGRDCLGGDLVRRPTVSVSVVLVVGVTLGAANLATAAGIPSARRYSLSTGPTYQLSGDRIHRDVSETFTLVNGSSHRVLVRRIGLNGSGLQLLAAEGSGTTRTLIPSTGSGPTRSIPPHASLRLRVWYHVTDCATVPKGRWPLTLEVARDRGRWQRVRVSMPSGPPVPWPRSMTDLVCP
jgi:hypothetical protein